MADRRFTDKTVLTIDDKEHARSFFRATLVSIGISVFEARSLEQGIELAKSLRPDVILCDLRMPGLEGSRILKEIRALGPGRGGSVPIIAVTAFHRLEDYAQASELGFNFFLIEPLNPDELVRALGEVLSRE